MIFDSDVLIWTLRGNEKAAQAIEQDEERAVSILSCMELIQGARNKAELAVIRRFLVDFETIALSQEIGYRGFLYMEQYALKAALTPIDALIAASAVEQQRTLCTANIKHFRQIPGLEIKAFRP